MKFFALVPDCPYRNRFCGLPNGISSEPLIAAMFSIEITGSMYFSLPALRNITIVSGTNIISETSFVTNIDVKNTPNIRNSEILVIFLSFDASDTTGRRTFSCLKPSSTQSIISSVASVRQSMSLSSRLLGGVMNIAATAAAADIVSISSFFRNALTLFIFIIFFL